MKMKVLAFTLLALVYLSSGLAATNDWTLVPDERAGPITFGMTKAEIVKIFGEKNVIDSNLGEDGQPAVTVFKDQQNEINVDMSLDPDPDVEGHFILGGASSIELFGDARSKWHFKNGLKLGMTFKELRRLNGAAVLVKYAPNDATDTPASFLDFGKGVLGKSNLEINISGQRVSYIKMSLGHAKKGQITLGDILGKVATIESKIPDMSTVYNEKGRPDPLHDGYLVTIYDFQRWVGMDQILKSKCEPCDTEYSVIFKGKNSQELGVIKLKCKEDGLSYSQARLLKSGSCWTIRLRNAAGLFNQQKKETIGKEDSSKQVPLPRACQTEQFIEYFREKDGKFVLPNVTPSQCQPLLGRRKQVSSKEDCWAFQQKQAEDCCKQITHPDVKDKNALSFGVAAVTHGWGNDSSQVTCGEVP